MSSTTSSLQQLKTEHQMLVERLMELEMEQEEHTVVIAALEPLDGTRRCHRLIGGILVERTVAEVLPALRRNQSSIEGAIDTARKVVRAREEEIIRLQKEAVVPELS